MMLNYTEKEEIQYNTIQLLMCCIYALYYSNLMIKNLKEKDLVMHILLSVKLRY